MNLFIYCAGGFGREIFDTAVRQDTGRGRWTGMYFIDDGAVSGTEMYGTTVFTLDGMLARFATPDVEVAIANGEPAIRQLLWEKLKRHGIRLATIVDPSAIVAPTATLGEGAVVTAFCIVASQAVLRENVALNVQAIVGHDIVLGEHTVVSSMVNVGGACTVGARSYLGMGVQIIQGVSVGTDAIVGMGSVVFSDIPDEVIALGNPARAMRKNVDKRVFKKY